MIASYQLKYWVFGVPGQQMGRELRASPVVFLKWLMGLFYLAWVDACTTGANRCMECARSQPPNMSRFIPIKIIFMWKEEEEERGKKHQVTHASVRLWRTKRIFIWMSHRKSRPTIGDWRNWLNCIFLYAYIASVSRPTTTHALKLIAGGTGKLRLGFVSLSLRNEIENEWRSGGTTSRICELKREQRRSEDETVTRLCTMGLLPSGLSAYLYIYTCIHVIMFHETGARPLGGLPSLSLLLANQSMDGLRT